MTIININDTWRISRPDETSYNVEKHHTGIAKKGKYKGNIVDRWKIEGYFNTLPQAMLYVLHNLIGVDEGKYMELKDVLIAYENVRKDILKVERQKALDELVAQAQKLNMGY